MARSRRVTTVTSLGVLTFAFHRSSRSTESVPVLMIVAIHLLVFSYPLTDPNPASRVQVLKLRLHRADPIRGAFDLLERQAKKRCAVRVQSVLKMLSNLLLGTSVYLERNSAEHIHRHLRTPNVLVCISESSSRRVSFLHSRSRSMVRTEFAGEEGVGLGPTVEFFTLVAHALQQKHRLLWLDLDQDTKEASQNHVVPGPVLIFAVHALRC